MKMSLFLHLKKEKLSRLVKKSSPEIVFLSKNGKISNIVMLWTPYNNNNSHVQKAEIMKGRLFHVCRPVACDMIMSLQGKDFLGNHFRFLSLFFFFLMEELKDALLMQLFM